jgi:hypothetical protein
MFHVTGRPASRNGRDELLLIRFRFRLRSNYHGLYERAGARPYRLLCRQLCRASADTVILKTEISHGVWVEQVPAIEDQRSVHQTSHFGKVNVLELFPFGGDDERLRVSDGLKCGRG